MANLTDIRSSWSTGASEGGVTVYATKEDLPTSGLTSGDQAYVTGNSRFYISNGSGWYNVALVNATPALTISPTGVIELSTEGTATTITLTATDSDNSVAGLSYSVESDGSFAGLASISQDSSVFTITPLSEDSATTTSAVLTFKASDGISFDTGDRTLTLSFKVANSNYTTLMLKADTAGTDNQVDASTIERTLTEAGNVTSTALSPYHPGGYSTYFDGSGDNLTISNFAITGDCTFEFWFYQDIAQSSAYRWMFGSSTYGSSSPLAIYTNSSNVEIWLTGSGSADITGAFTAFTWHHVALVRNSGTWTLYIDGVSAGTSTTSGSYDFAATADWQYGENLSGSYDWKGYIRDARIVDGTAVYTSAFTAPTAPLTAITNTELLTCHLPYIADGSTNSHTITVNGNTSTERFGPYDYLGYTKADYGGSVYFDGTGDYITTPADTTHLTMSGDFTIDFWIYPTSAYSNDFIYGKWNNNSDGWAIFATTDWSSGNFGSLTFYYGNYGSNESATNIRTEKIKQNQWNHCRITRESGVFYMAINGVVGARSNYGANGLSWSDTRTFNANATIGIGGNTAGYSKGPGYMAELRVINGTALSTTDFTPPTAPVTAVTNTKLLTCTNKNDIWDAANGKLLTKLGDVTASATQRQFTSSSAIYFDGTDAVENIIDAIGDGDFTFEGWFNITADTAGNYQMVFDNRSTLSTGPMLFYYEVDDKLYPYLDGTAFTSNNAISQNTWYHWALVRNNNACTFYLNGTAQTSNAGTSITTNFTSTEFNIGRSSSVGSPANGDYFIGYQQDFRVTKGLARYTSNFTPPTAEFSG